jgi:hypothetical protein
MNEQLIGDLFAEATRCMTGSSSREFSEKFAELIVKETMQVVANNLPQNTYLDVADAVIEHFGVEE